VQALFADMPPLQQKDLANECWRRRMQAEAHPDAGDVIPRMGGLRKIRLALPGRGKRGGARVLYLAFVRAETLFLPHLEFLLPSVVLVDLVEAENVRPLRVNRSRTNSSRPTLLK
jgi:hypothetical protein